IEGLSSLLGQVNPQRAAVIGIGASLDQSRLFRAIQEPGERAGIQTDLLRQVARLLAIAVSQATQQKELWRGNLMPGERLGIDLTDPPHGDTETETEHFFALEHEIGDRQAAISLLANY